MADKIQTMIPRYGELNRIYRDYCWMLREAIDANTLFHAYSFRLHGHYRVLTGRDATWCVREGTDV